MAQKNTPLKESQQEPFVFGKNNYRLLLLSIAMVVLGFILMIGETDIYEFKKSFWPQLLYWLALVLALLQSSKNLLKITNDYISGNHSGHN